MKRVATLRCGLECRAIALAAAVCCAAPVMAMEVPTGDADLSVRWDNSLRATGGWRLGQRQDALANNPALDEGNFKFDKGDMYTKRVDLLSELELSWQKRFGFRLAGSAWYDDAYADATVRRNPAFASVPTSYQFSSNGAGTYTNYTKRYFYRGGEFLDAFIFASFEPAGMPVSVKLGKLATTWGQSFFFGGGVASQQQPQDLIKALSSPGTEVREIALPLQQALLQVQVTPTVALGAQYYFDWRAVRAPEGGTYFAAGNFALAGPTNTGVVNPQAPGFELLPRGDAQGPAHKSGNFGIYAKLAPELLQGETIGLYYRKFDTKNAPWLMLQGGVQNIPQLGPTFIPSNYQFVYARDTELYGLSYDGSIGGIAVGAEVGYQKHAGLQSGQFSVTADGQGAYGNTWFAVFNTFQSLSKTALWDTGVLIAELSYERLDKVTQNAMVYNGVGQLNQFGSPVCKNNATGAAGTEQDGCASKEAWGLGVRFMPQWLQVAPGVDLSMPAFVLAGLKGSSPGFGGTIDKFVNVSIGVEALVQNKHIVNLTWAKSHAPLRTLGGVAVGGPSAFPLNDRERIALTYKYAF